MQCKRSCSYQHSISPPLHSFQNGLLPNARSSNQPLAIPPSSPPLHLPTPHGQHARPRLTHAYRYIVSLLSFISHISHPSPSGTIHNSKQQTNLHPSQQTELETYLSRTLSLTLLPLALLPILLTGLLPLTSMSAESESQHSGQPSPYSPPTTFILTTFEIAGLVYCYVTWQRLDVVCFAFGAVGSGGLAAWGVWCLVFGGGGEGGEKRVSGWPFRNKEEREAKREKMARRKGL